MASASGTPGMRAIAGVPGMQDVGQFIVSASGPVRAENRAASTLLHLAQGDEIQFPAGMVWGTLPNVSVFGPRWIAASVRVSGHKLYLTGDASGTISGLASFERVDDRTFRVISGGMVLFWANEDGVFGEGGTLADYPIAIDAAGHLWLASLPVPPNLVVDYPTGVGIDTRSMKRVGWLPSEDHTHIGQAGGFFFTTCNPERCSYTDRLAAPLTAPFTGTLICRSGYSFDLVGDGFRLQFRDVATLIRPWNATPTPTPVADCGSGIAVKSGQEIDETAGHYIVSAMSSSGEPLSVVVAYDGTLYVGPLAVPPLDGPGRAN